MAKDHDFESGDPFTTSDLVQLYKKVDLDNQMIITNTNQCNRNTSNQYIEDVIYHDDADTDSNLSEISSANCEDLENTLIVTKGKFDVLNTELSLKSLCHKLSDLEIQVSNISTDYGHNFIFQDSYIKEHVAIPQWKYNANKFDTPVAPSLLDFICCKQLEDRFYMNNIIKYVEHTIEKLRRISDGDYLPDGMKEIWKKADHNKIKCDASKVLSTSLSTPFQIKRKVAEVTPAWVDIVYSEVDFKSLLKMLDKSIFLDIPKMIVGSYNSFTIKPVDSLIISCKSKKQLESKNHNRQWSQRKIEPPVDVTFQLQCSKTDQFLSKIGSIVISQFKQEMMPKDCTDTLSSTYKEEEIIPKVIELHEGDTHSEKRSSSFECTEFGSLNSLTGEEDNDDFESEHCSARNELNRPGSPNAVAQILVGSVSRLVRTETMTNHATPNDLQFSILDLDSQSSLPVDSLLDSVYTNVRNKSPVKARIKSLYENKSVILEEKKRKRLLEIRERREKKKRAMSDKITKHKPPQAVNSVTKLSITNKSFYNSIYGRNMNSDISKRESNTIAATVFDKIEKSNRTLNKNDVIEETLHESEQDVEKEDTLSDRPSTMIKGHFLDEIETEVSYEQRKENNFLRNSSATSIASNISATNLSTKSNPSVQNVCIKGQKSVMKKQWSEHEMKISETTSPKVPSNSPKGDSDTGSPAVECRRSIEKIFTLMKKLHHIESNKVTSKKTVTLHKDTKYSSLSSESITNINHSLSFKNHSSRLDYSLRDINNESESAIGSLAVVPKVVIDTKLQSMETEETRNKLKKPSDIRAKDENPLKAISQLLHEFDNIKKSRQKHADPKSINRSIATEPRNVSPGLQKRRSQIKSPVKLDLPTNAIAKMKTRFTAREEIRPEVAKTRIQDRKKINDLIDEAREARGEAVRGPPKFSSRLNMLAQPKRTYVQALNEDLSRRQILERTRATRQHRRGSDNHSLNVSVKQPPSTERAARLPHSASGSPESRCTKSSLCASLASTTAPSLQPSLKKKSIEVKSRSRANNRSSYSTERIEPVRAPLLPKDLILRSMSRTSPIPKEDIPQSSNIGSKVHNMVASMLSTKRDSGHADPATLMINPSIEELTPSSSIDDDDFTHRNDIDTLIEETLIEKTCKPDESHFVVAPNIDTHANSIVELKMLEHALYRKLSCGAFSSRLRLNKLTLTPKPSLQCTINHQPGDTSLTIKPDLSLKTQAFSKPNDKKIDLIALLSTSKLNCDIYGFPLRIPKVGFGPSDSGTSYIVYEKRLPTTRALKIKKAMNDDKTYQSVMVEAKSSEVGVDVQVSCYDCVPMLKNVLNSSTTIVTEQGDALRRNVETNTTEESIVFPPDIAKEHVEENISCTAEKNHELSEYTTSLDMLVGLLNEIQRITAFPSDVLGTETLEYQQNELRLGRNPDVLNHENSVLSITESSKINVEDCFPLVISNEKTNNDAQIEAFVAEDLNPEATRNKPEEIEKKISVEQPKIQNQLAEVGTDTESCFSILPEQTKSFFGISTMKTGNDARTSVVNVPTSKCSMSLITPSKATTKTCDIIIDQIGRNRGTVKSLVPFYDNISKIQYKNTDRAVTHTQAQDILSQGNVISFYDDLTNSVPVRRNKTNMNDYNEVQNQNFKILVNKCSTGPDLDTTLKFKKRVLVTFYSFLVLTVFVALEVPEICLNL